MSDFRKFGIEVVFKICEASSNFVTIWSTKGFALCSTFLHNWDIILYGEGQQVFLEWCKFSVDRCSEGYFSLVDVNEFLVVLSTCLLRCSRNSDIYIYIGLFISPSGFSELDCATTKTDTAERGISIGRESLQVFFCTRGLGVLVGSTARG